MKLILSLLLLVVYSISNAVSYTGIYSYNKGVNKANGTLYVTHFKEDSAFFMVQTVSGMPDFFTTEIKGFMQIENNMGLYIAKDSCKIEFTFTTVSCSLNENIECKFDFSTNGKYKKTSPKLKKGSSMMPLFVDKKGTVKTDTVYCLSAPNASSATQCLLQKNDEVQITDEFNGYYLIELKNKKNEFLWVWKKNIQLIKTK